MRAAMLLALGLALAGCGRNEQPSMHEAAAPAPAPAPPTSSVDVLVAVPEVVGKSQSEVEALLGKPASCESTKHGPKCAYAKGETEVVFIDGKADWITVEGLDEAPYAPATLDRLGFKDLGAPSQQDGNAVRWDRPADLVSVSLFPGAGDRADYAYIKARTE